MADLRTDENRTSNPLDTFSSYTYIITLYMITPSAYDAFIASGRTNINAIRNAASAQINQQLNKKGVGAFIIAQSGGYNREKSDLPGFELDYYIDNLKIKTSVNPTATQSHTNITELRLNIIEPYGFSFITKLRNASEYLIRSNPDIKGYTLVTNAAQQFFMLGIKFIGYDKDGNPISSDDKNFNNSSNNYELFYDIVIKNVKFKLDGKATVYNVSARATKPAIGFGLKYGRIPPNLSVQASTVGEALERIAEKLNNVSTDAAKQTNTIANRYSFEIVGASTEDEDKIRKASLITQSDKDKNKTGTSDAKTTIQINPVTVRDLPNLSQKLVQFGDGTSILDALTQIISNSQYLESALAIIRKSQLEQDQSIKEKGKVINSGDNKISWFNVSAEVKVLGWDNVRKDWAFDIKYIIQPYLTPAVTSVYAKNGQVYYGPVKRYNYWFTGENSEVLSYEHDYNNMYYTVALDANAQYGQAIGARNEDGNLIGNMPPQVITQQQDSQKLDNVGPGGGQAQGSYITALYDPSSQAKAKINILGDPDFLITESTSSVKNLYNQLYGPNGAISANGGQVFIEIKFNEAKDYNTDGTGKFSDTGLLYANDKIFFWDYPKSLIENKIITGVVYMVKYVTSYFSNGKFTQDLDLMLPPVLFKNEADKASRPTEDESAAEKDRLLRQAGSISPPAVSSVTNSEDNPPPPQAGTPLTEKDS